MTAPLPPIPAHLLRSHASSITALSTSEDNERIYSGDMSGRVVITSTRSLRAIANWVPHTNGLLGIEEWDSRVVTHARDNKLHVWTRIEEAPPSKRLGASASVPDLPTPKLLYSMDVNALNFCRFSLLRLCDTEKDTKEPQALIALPNLIESSVADVWIFPSRERLHALVGQEPNLISRGGRKTTGIIMSIHIFFTEGNYDSSTSTSTQNLNLLCAYEDGSVTLRRYTEDHKIRSVEGKGWQTVWSVKAHGESIMAMRVSLNNTLALTVSVDHTVGRYDLSHNTDTDVDAKSLFRSFRTKHAGNSSIAIRDDGKVCAIGGWDGNIRLYSTGSLKPLGTLKYHKTGCQALEFLHISDLKSTSPTYEGEEDDDMESEEKEERSRWLVGGGKDNRVSIWALISFDRNEV